MTPHKMKRRHSSSTPSARLAPDSLAWALLQAARMVAAVRAGSTLDRGLEALWRDPSLTAQQRGAIQDLAYGTLRDYGRGEALLARLLRSPPAEPIDSLLLVALHRLEHGATQAHTLVDQSVAAATVELGGKLKGLVNAVLRSYLREREALHAAIANQAEALHRHPAWWIDTLHRAYPDDAAAILAAGNAHPPMALRVNRRRSSVAEQLDRLAARQIGARPWGADALILDRPLPVTAIPGFAEGQCSVQDPGAQQAAALLDLSPGQRVLDACAAPGGKTAHMLELCDVEVDALDISAARLQRVRENLERLGLSARLCHGDSREPAGWWDGRPYQRILADVPCSASGVVRRHPDIKWLRRHEDIAGFAAQQAAILDALWQTLAAGGKMLYATCSMFPSENAEQIAAFARRHADARILPLSGAPAQQLLPCAEHDGFFYALLQKTP